MTCPYIQVNFCLQDNMNTKLLGMYFHYVFIEHLMCSLQVRKFLLEAFMPSVGSTLVPMCTPKLAFVHNICLLIVTLRYMLTITINQAN